MGIEESGEQRLSGHATQERVSTRRSGPGSPVYVRCNVRLRGMRLPSTLLGAGERCWEAQAIPQAHDPAGGLVRLPRAPRGATRPGGMKGPTCGPSQRSA